MKWLWILLLVPSICFGAGEVATVGGKADSAIASVAGKTGTGIASICGKTYNDSDGCDPASNEVGDRTTDGYTNTNPIGNGEMDCFLYQADCTGTANTAMLYAVTSSGTDNCKIGLCDSADGSTEHSPATHDNNCVWSSGDTIINKSEWITLTGDLGKATTNTSYYWMCVLGGTDGCNVKYKNPSGSKKLYYTTGFTYSSPPSNLNGTWTEVAGRNMSAYVEID